MARAGWQGTSPGRCARNGWPTAGRSPSWAVGPDLDPAHLGRVESGRRATEAIAAALDGVFPSRRGWFTDWLSESREWAEMPATFRSWPDYEDRAATIRAWSPGILHGLVQTEDYARALITVQPGVTPEVTGARLTARAERQRRVLDRTDSPPSVWVVADELALYRQVGTPAVMAGQMRRLAEIAAMPLVTLHRHASDRPRRQRERLRPGRRRRLVRAHGRRRRLHRPANRYQARAALR